MKLHFNEISLEIIKLRTLFESLITITEEDLMKVEESVKNPLSYIYKVNIWYANLKNWLNTSVYQFHWPLRSVL